VASENLVFASKAAPSAGGPSVSCRAGARRIGNIVVRTQSVAFPSPEKTYNEAREEGEEERHERHPESGSKVRVLAHTKVLGLVMYVDVERDVDGHEDHGHEHYTAPRPYVPIGNDDPYRILPPNLNDEDAILKNRGMTSTKKWRALKPSHTSSSAKISVLYPVAWEGTVSGKTVSGNIETSGDLKIIKYSRGWAYKEIVAGKSASKAGEGSTATMSSISGSLSFHVD